MRLRNPGSRIVGDKAIGEGVLVQAPKGGDEVLGGRLSAASVAAHDTLGS
jgi:hypothetical protein